MRRSFSALPISEARIEEEMLRLQEKQEKARLAAIEDGPVLEYLVFAVSGEEFAAPLQQVESVVALPRVTPVPFMPEEHKGVINLRGRIVSVIDLRVKMDVPSEVTPETSVIVIKKAEQHYVGMMVDSVNRVLSVKLVEEIKPVKLLDLETIIRGGAL